MGVVTDADPATAAGIAAAGARSFRSVKSRELNDPQRMIEVLGRAGRGVGLSPALGAEVSPLGRSVLQSPCGHRLTTSLYRASPIRALVVLGVAALIRYLGREGRAVSVPQTAEQVLAE